MKVFFEEDWMCMFMGYMNDLGTTDLSCINIMEYDANGKFLRIWPGEVTDEHYVAESEEEPVVWPPGVMNENDRALFSSSSDSLFSSSSSGDEPPRDAAKRRSSCRR